MSGFKVLLKIATLRKFRFMIAMKGRWSHHPGKRAQASSYYKKIRRSQSEPGSGELKVRVFDDGCDCVEVKQRHRQFIIRIIKILTIITSNMKKAIKFRLSHVISWLIGVAMSVTSFLLTKGGIVIPPPQPPTDIITDTIVRDDDKSIILTAPGHDGSNASTVHESYQATIYKDGNISNVEL